MRGRWTTRLDVEGRMERAALPAPARELIRRVVKRTRLWRVERADVADELIAHFADGLEGGQAVEELIASFCDERRAAKLIRRAKRRNRPLPWHAMIFLRRVVVALVVIYLLLTVRFYTGDQPRPLQDFCLRMMDEAEVSISPGRAFGEQGEGFVRIALVENDQRLKQAMNNLDRALNPRPPKKEKRQPATA